MATATSAIADQLAEVVLCVNYLVEQLEAEEERAELDFFQAERDEIEREFEVRLNELRLTLTKTDLEQANAIRSAAELQQQQQQQYAHQATVPIKQFQQPPVMPQNVQNQFQQPQIQPPQPQQPQQQQQLQQQPQPVPQPIIQQAAPVPVAQFSLPFISQPAAAPAAIAAPAVVSLTAAPLPSLSTPVLLDCGPEHHSVEVWSTHGELIEALAHDGETTRYRLPNVTPHACELLLQCLRARANLMARASISSNGAAPSLHQFRTNDFVSDIDLSQVLDASNVLRVPWLFILLTTRLFNLNKGDLAFLHSFLSKSFLQHLEPAFMMQLQDRMLHGAYSSTNEHEKNAASSSQDIVESMKPVWNMFWYQVVSRLFPNYKQHLKSRIQILHHSSAKLQTCAWLEPKDDKAAEAAGKATAAGAPAPILWVRIYLELSFAKQLLDLTRLSPNSGTQPIKLYEDCMQQWRSMGFLVHYVNIDLHPASAAGNEVYSFEQKQRIVNFIIPMVKETIHLAALSLNDVQLEPQQFLLLLATAMQLQVLQFKQMEPSMHRSQMQTLQIYQRFPKIQLLLE